MGCISSKKDLTEINPNIYSVENVDRDGTAVWEGQLELNRSELILHRRGREPTRWPLQCLRRYGYDSEIFTFESGRRCATGEGIYGFRCRRAESLFRTLQNYLQRSATMNDDLTTVVLNDQYPIPVATNGPAVAPRNIRASVNSANMDIGGSLVGSYIMASSNRPTNQNLSPSSTLQSNSNRSRSSDTLTTVEGNYLEPTPNRQTPVSRFHTGMRLNSVSSGPLSPDPHSPGSPNSITNILEVTTLNPLPHPTNHSTHNVYQEFPLREYNNNSYLVNKKFSLDIPPQEPAPGLSHIQRGPNDPIVPISLPNAIVTSSSPTTMTIPNSDSFDSAQMYMNIKPGEITITGTSHASNLANSISMRTISSGSDTISVQGSTNTGIIATSLQTPTTSIASFQFNRLNSSYSIQDRCYENLEPAEVRPLLLRNRLSKPDIFAKFDYVTSERSEPATPTPSIPTTCVVTTTPAIQQSQLNRQVIYCVLDLDQSSNHPNVSATSTTVISTPTISTYCSDGDPSNTSSPPKINTITSSGPNFSSLLPPESPKQGALDYATIDFNKTAALSNSITPSSDLDSDGLRKTRHSSVATSQGSITPMGTGRHSNSISD